MSKGLDKLQQDTKKGVKSAEELKKEYSDIQAVLEKIKKLKKDGRYNKAQEEYNNLLKNNVEVAKELNRLANERKNLTEENLSYLKSAANLEFGDAVYNLFGKAKRGIEKGSAMVLEFFGKTKEEAKEIAEEIPRIISGTSEALSSQIEQTPFDLIDEKKTDRQRRILDAFFRGYNRDAKQQTEEIIKI